jgi:hypothetical protein
MSLPACFSSCTGGNAWGGSAPTAAAAAAGAAVTGLAALQLPGMLMQLTCLTSLQLTLTAGESMCSTYGMTGGPQAYCAWA